MHLSDYDYDLPPDRIAQQPVEPRDAARLLVLERRTGRIAHRHFRDLPELLLPGDLLVVNDTRVLHARLHGHKSTGGRVEVLLLRPRTAETWEALIGGRVRPGSHIVFGEAEAIAEARVDEVLADGTRVVTFSVPALEVATTFGEVPLPPYIKSPLSDPERYQTVYAAAPGAAAAPTAGLHFTPDLLERLAAAGIGRAALTLHVGTDTFRPISEADVVSHTMHREWFTLPEATADALVRTRAAGGRIVAVGTTVVRALEAAAATGAGAGWTDLYITPGYAFRNVDILVTNFHLPRSTLLVLVAAFAGLEHMRAAYETAIASGYRFYSFGDAMLVI